MSSDPRSRRVAVVADSLLEPLLDELRAEGFGIIQLPPAGLDGETVHAWLEQVAEHVAEFRRNDYEVVLVSDGLYAEELEALGLPQYAIQPPSTSRLTPDT
ncbi:MAG TPA: hypothetical protein VGJ25_00470 [Gaiellaceae bacterium]|jgi:hypothetical protein